MGPAGDEGTRLQVVVGCSRVLTEAREIPAPEVAGLDAARRLELTFGLGRDDDATTLRASGLYGHAGAALVLVELSAPAGDHDGALANEVLGSVRADPDGLAADCS